MTNNKAFAWPKSQHEHASAWFPVAPPSFTLPVPLPVASRSWGVSRIFINNSSKAWSTATLALALVSTKRHPCFCAKSCPSSADTWRCPSRSTLLATTMCIAPSTVLYSSTSRIHTASRSSNVSRRVTS
eukprot:366009-Chlamydomonas_euryale.AAC.16